MNEFILKTINGEIVWKTASIDLAVSIKKWFCERGCYVSIVNKYA